MEAFIFCSNPVLGREDFEMHIFSFLPSQAERELRMELRRAAQQLGVEILARKGSSNLEQGKRM